MTATRKMTVREAKARSKQSEWLTLAAFTARGYGYTELAVQLDALSEVVRAGKLEFDVDKSMGDL